MAQFLGLPDGFNLTCEYRIASGRQSNINFKKSTKVLNYTICFMISTFFARPASVECKCRNRTKSVLLSGVAFSAASLVLVMTATVAVARPKGDDQCLSQAEVRELVSQKTVTAPGPVLRKARAAAGPGAKVLRAVLCRRDGQYVYRVAILVRDGRVVHQVVVARPARSDPPR